MWNHVVSNFGDWYYEAKAQVKAPAPGVSTYRTKSAEEKNVDKVLDDFVVSKSLSNRTNKVEVIEEYKSEQQKAVRCEILFVNADKWKNVVAVLCIRTFEGRQEWNGQS